MKHNETVQAEFARQSASFRVSKALNADEVTRDLGDFLGPDVERTLDIACGPGILLPALAMKSASVFGIDLTSENLQLAKAENEARSVFLLRGVAEQLPFRPGSFDAVVVRLALHHFEEPEAVLAAARTALRDSGRIVILDILGPADPPKFEVRDALERFRDPSHTSLLTAARMRRKLSSAGFVIAHERVWSQQRSLSDWSAVINDPKRTNDFETILRAIARSGDDPSGLNLTERDGDLWFSYEWGLFVADAA